MNRPFRDIHLQRFHQFAMAFLARTGEAAVTPSRPQRKTRPSAAPTAGPTTEGFLREVRWDGNGPAAPAGGTAASWLAQLPWEAGSPPEHPVSRPAAGPSLQSMMLRGLQDASARSHQVAARPLQTTPPLIPDQNTTAYLASLPWNP